MGYFTRVTGLKRLLDTALRRLSSAKAKDGSTIASKVQVISVGAGYDTLYWRLQQEKNARSALRNFVEVDLPEVAAKKCFMIKKSKALMEAVASSEDDDVRLKGRTDLHGSDYHVVAADFTDLDGLERKLDECGVDYACPTVFLAECALVYVAPNAGNALLRWCADKFTANVAFVDHEQVNLGDRFGRVMLENLNARGCGLPGAAACENRASQIRRFRSNGWDGARCWTMNEAYALLPASEVDRVEQLELFDERELMRQLFDHYCLTIAWKGEGIFDSEENDAQFWSES